MKSRIVTMAIVGTVLTSILSGSMTYAQNQLQGEAQAAEVVRELLDQGYLQIDPATGRLLIKRSVYDILRHYNQGEAKVLQINDDIGIKTTGKCESF